MVFDMKEKRFESYELSHEIYFIILPNSGVQLLKSMCNATAKGDVMGSTELEFHPGDITSGKFNVDTGTAGYLASS